MGYLVMELIIDVFDDGGWCFQMMLGYQHSDSCVMEFKINC